MGYLSDSLDFEKFFAKDLLKGIKKDPKRLVLGVDPASTWAWNKVLGRDDKPLVDQMGGPYDGRVLSYGHGNGGVYDRAQAAGIDTGSASMNHDAAHLIAGSYAASGLGGDLFGNGGGSGGNTDLFAKQAGNTTNFSTGMPTGANPAAGLPGIAGPVGGGGGGGAAGAAGAGLGAMDYAKLGMSAMGAVQQPQQQQAPPPPQRAGLGQRIQNGLFPINPQVAQQNPEYAKQMQSNAMLQLGLGMAAAGRQPGATFGAALGAGLGRAQTDLNGAMQTAYQNARQARADTRAESREDREMQREDRLDSRQQWLEDHTLDREKTSDQRYQTEQDFRLKQADQAQKRWESEQAAQAQYRKDQLDARAAGTVPTGYRIKKDGSGLEFIPGGPADPSVATSQRTLRPIPSSAAKGIIENRASLKQLDRALAAVEQNPDAFGAHNYLPDAVTQRVGGAGFSGGLDARAQVADIGSLKLHDRSGAAVTAAEFPRLKPFIPQATDDPETVKKKLQNLKANLESMQEEIEGFYTPESGYRPVGGGAQKEDPLGIR